MKEQSHKDEMSAAIRGDFRRLRARGVAATLAPRDDDRPETEPVDALHGAEPTALQPEHEPEVDEPLARPGFLARLLGR